MYNRCPSMVILGQYMSYSVGDIILPATENSKKIIVGKLSYRLLLDETKSLLGTTFKVECPLKDPRYPLYFINRISSFEAVCQHDRYRNLHIIVNLRISVNLNQKVRMHCITLILYFHLIRNWTVNHDVGCKTYPELEADITHLDNITSNNTYCKENDTKYCQTRCPTIQFDELQCALPRCPNITKNTLIFSSEKQYPEAKGARLQNKTHRRFDNRETATFECEDNCKWKFMALSLSIVPPP